MKVKFIGPVNRYTNNFTIDKIYELNFGRFYAIVIGDNGNSVVTTMKYFKPIEEVRDEKLNMILDDA